MAFSFSLFTIVKSSNSFSLNNFVLFGEIDSRQCVCNNLFSICWPLIGNICNWKTSYLSYLLVGSDKLYKSVNIQIYLYVEKLPTGIVLFSHAVTLKFLMKAFKKV